MFEQLIVWCNNYNKEKGENRIKQMTRKCSPLSITVLSQLSKKAADDAVEQSRQMKFILNNVWTIMKQRKANKAKVYPYSTNWLCTSGSKNQNLYCTVSRTFSIQNWNDSCVCNVPLALKTGFRALGAIGASRTREGLWLHS